MALLWSQSEVCLLQWGGKPDVAPEWTLLATWVVLWQEPLSRQMLAKDTQINFSISSFLHSFGWLSCTVMGPPSKMLFVANQMCRQCGMSGQKCASANSPSSKLTL